MAVGGVPRASGSRTVGSVEDIALDSGCRLIRCGDPVCGMLHEFGEVGYLLDSGNRSGIGLVGRSPWTAADARLLAGRPGGRPRARAPAPHRSTERGLPEASRYPNRGNQSWLESVAPPYRGAVTPVGAGASSNRAMRAPGVRPTMRTVWLPAPRYRGVASFSVVQEASGPSLEGCSARSRMLLSSTRTVKPPARWGHQQTALSRYAPSAGISMRQVALAAGETKSRAPVMLSLSGLACCDAATPTYLPCPAEESSPRARGGVMDAAASASTRTVSAAAAGGGVLARPNSPLVYSNHACRPWTSYVDPAGSGFAWRAMRMS